jgi:hypothetical protein
MLLSDKRPISQKELAELCTIPVDTIKSIEVGRLALSPTVLRKITEATGAYHEQARWTQSNGTPFTYSFFRKYRQRRPGALSHAIDGIRVDLIKSRIDWLFKNVPGQSWNALQSRLTYFLEECKRDLKLTSDDALFYKPWPDVPKDLTATQLAKSKKQKHHYPPGSAGNKKYKRMYGPKADLAKT